MKKTLQLYSSNWPVNLAPSGLLLYRVLLTSGGTKWTLNLMPPTTSFFKVTHFASLLLRSGKRVSVLLWGIRLDAKVNWVKGVKFWVKLAGFPSKDQSFG